MSKQLPLLGRWCDIQSACLQCAHTPLRLPKLSRFCDASEAYLSKACLLLCQDFKACNVVYKKCTYCALCICTILDMWVSFHFMQCLAKVFMICIRFPLYVVLEPQTFICFIWICCDRVMHSGEENNFSTFSSYICI